jgi:hypothetical protein
MYAGQLLRVWRVSNMKLQEVDTIQELKDWVEENMQGARLTVDSAGDIVIHTGLVSTMGGYLHKTGDEE